jgi:hypothetical protein
MVLTAEELSETDGILFGFRTRYGRMVPEYGVTNESNFRFDRVVVEEAEMFRCASRFLHHYRRCKKLHDFSGVEERRMNFSDVDAMWSKTHAAE